MQDEGTTYISSLQAGPFRQGEILSNVGQHIITAFPNDPSDTITVVLKTHPFAIVLSQDCDLAQHFSVHTSGTHKRSLTNILMCEVDLAETLKRNGAIPVGSEIWKRIQQNKDERYHFLRDLPAELDAKGEGAPSLLADFKRYFTLPTEILYEQVTTSAKRRACLTSPYMEHISSRYAYYLSRVALPLDHHQAIGSTKLSTD